ncbi:MAG: HAMP domain-containing protein, partial [Anaerolineae bacterium]|nr:HAMP domain-containing protein [Anaerolineae bacterium]
MLKRHNRFLFDLGLGRALAESLLLSAPFLIGLLGIEEGVYHVVLEQGAVLLALATALWYGLRLRFPEGNRGEQLFREGLAAGVMSVSLMALCSIIALGIGRWYRLADSWLGVVGVPLLMSGSGIAFLGYRCVARLWLYWRGLRRRKLLWELTHIQLQLMFLVGLAGALLLMSAGFLGGLAGSTQGFADFVVSVLLSLIPLLGVASTLTILMAAISLPLTILLALRIARRTTRRLDALANTAAALRQGDFSARVEVNGEDEVARLQADFNAMASDLEGAVRDLQAERDKVTDLLKERRQLVANVSHELRTPVATVRGYIESAQDGWADTPPQTLRHDLDVMQGEVARLERLIDDLFTLSCAAVRALDLELRPTDVAEIVARCVESIVPLAWRSSRVEVVCEVPPDLPRATANATRLEQVLVNLLHNGVRHTQPGGIVAAVVSAEDDSVRVDVRDTGEGIPPEELPHIWERFYRGGTART